MQEILYSLGSSGSTNKNATPANLYRQSGWKEAWGNVYQRSTQTAQKPHKSSIKQRTSVPVGILEVHLRKAKGRMKTVNGIPFQN